MKDNTKIQKIAGWVFLSGVIIFLVSRGLWLFALCGFDNYPSGFSGVLCHFVYSELGKTIVYITYYVGIALVLGGGIVWLMKVIQKNKSETTKL